MDFLPSRYRNLTVLLLVIFAQLLLLAYQVKTSQDVRLVRVWAVTAVTPLARFVEGVRLGTTNLLEQYVLLRHQGEENRRLKGELGRLKMESQRLRSELETADRLRVLSEFQPRTPSRTLAARVIGTGTGASSKVVFVDRGSSSGVMKGMAVVTPDGIVGKIIAAYPTASQVLLALGHLGTFYFPNVGPGATINSPVPLTPGVLADFSDGYVKTSLWMDTLPGFNFNAYVGFADVTLQVNGTEVPEPASWLLTLIGFGLFSHPRRRSSEVRG